MKKQDLTEDEIRQEQNEMESIESIHRFLDILGDYYKNSNGNNRSHPTLC